MTATTAPKKATATAVSKALTAAGMTKSVKYKVRIGYHRTSGFCAGNETVIDNETLKRIPTGEVRVSWVSGNFVRLPGDAESETANLAKASEILTSRGFTVETVVSASGYTTLTVTR